MNCVHPHNQEDCIHILLYKQVVLTNRFRERLILLALTTYLADCLSILITWQQVQ